MLISGTISTVSPPDFSDRHGNHYQNITVDAPQGQITGRIGCKKPYTNQNIGQQGQWDTEQATSPQGQYNKFKKHYDTPYQGQQAPPQATGRPSSNKDRLIVAQVVYKVLAEVHCAEPTNPNEFDVWLMGNQLVLKKHVDLIMEIGAGETPKQNPMPNTARHCSSCGAPERTDVKIGEWLFSCECYKKNSNDDIPF